MSSELIILITRGIIAIVEAILKDPGTSEDIKQSLIAELKVLDGAAFILNEQDQVRLDAAVPPAEDER